MTRGEQYHPTTQIAGPAACLLPRRKPKATPMQVVTGIEPCQTTTSSIREHVPVGRGIMAEVHNLLDRQLKTQ
jgi:hypothetical protein